MRVIMFSWEFPPKSVGGLGQHVYDITEAMARQGDEIHLLTCGAAGAPEFERINGVNVYRVNPYAVSSPDFVTWVMQLNVAMLERAIPLLMKLGSAGILHAHDWLVTYVARALKHAFQLPLVATIHATEYGRNNGLHNKTQQHISDIEWWLTYEAWRVICCSTYMERELNHVFQLPDDKIRVIPNGVNPDSFRGGVGEAKRENYAAADEKIVFYVGRLVREKGVELLLEAAPKILHYHPKTKFIIAGKGPQQGHLQYLADRLGISQRIYFTGYINDGVKNGLYRYADVAVFPSYYEPFGIVALEAMAARTPVVVSDAGGLGEIINHRVNGMKFYNGNANSLADSILHVLMDPPAARTMQERAYQDVVQRYNWDKIARTTRALYREVVDAHKTSAWGHYVSDQLKDKVTLQISQH